MKRLLVLFVIGVLIAGFGEAMAGSYTTDLTFETYNQSMWGPGTAFTLNYHGFVGPQWDERYSVGGIARDPFFGTKWGAELWGETDGRIGFQVDADADSGSVNVTYPVGIKLSYPDKAAPGETFTITSSYVMNSGASMTTNFPEAHISVDGIFEVYAKVGGEVCAVGCAGGSATLMDVAVQVPILDIDTGEISADILGIGSVKATFPDIDTTATLAGKTLKSQGEDDFMEVMLDVDKGITMLTGIPLNGNVFGIGYNILDANAGAILTATQEFSFMPKLMVGFQFENGKMFSMQVGSSMSFVFPEGYGDLDVTPTFWLDNVFSNDTGMRVDSKIDVSALSASAFGIDIGPLFTYNTRGTLGELDIFSNDFSLQGFEKFTTASFTVAATPEPATFVLLGLGLAASLVYKRKRIMA